MKAKRQMMKTIRKVVISAIVTLKSDNKFFAKPKVDVEDVVALLDSGASANFIVNGALEFIKTQNRQVIRIQGEKFRIADGGETVVIGAISLPVVWNGLTRDMEFFIVPALQQEFYFGVVFWPTFGVSVISKCARVGVGTTTSALVDELKYTSSDLTFYTDLNILTKEKEVALEAVKARIPP